MENPERGTSAYIIGLCQSGVCQNKSLFQALESSPVVFLVMLHACCSANHSTFYGKNSKSAGLANGCGQPKFDAITCEPCSYYDSASVLKWPQKQSQSIYFSKNFLGEHAPSRPSLACLCMHVTPLLKIPGYRPVYCICIFNVYEWRKELHVHTKCLS